ncbi:hypothetical protein [Aneurinibacillus aneurinilyticus]|uniref:Uncharacterized protein n=1 Tax=Aneurinibacillus aneurinilyticus TaxID=1391 RepID=A0A848CYB6_ANEAE|nr:hypothetical protein [Aneurinibacillus aneurinilyticus]NME98436.1 hypothetical protein [Aneurinibacillus aneurinilyticus]
MSFFNPEGRPVALVTGSYKSMLWTSPYTSMMGALDSYLAAGQMRLGNPREVAELVAHIAVMKHATLRYSLGGKKVDKK